MSEDCIEKFDIIKFGIEEGFDGKKDMSVPYILYAGRLDEGKGVKELIENFSSFLEKHSEMNLFLFLMGDGPLESTKHPKIKYLGMVDEDKKLDIFKNVIAFFIHPPSRV